MRIRKTRAGDYWVGDNKVSASDVEACVSIPESDISHFDIGDGFSKAWRGCDQLAPGAEIEAFAVDIMNHATAIVAARDARLAAEYEASHPPLTEAQEAASKLAISDGGMARVIEDLIDVLVGKGLLELSELPTAAQARVNERKDLRTVIKGA